jgi:hypothetical protein
MTLRTLLFIALGVLSLIFLIRWIVQARTSGPSHRRPSLVAYAIGFGTNFFAFVLGALMTIGIGNYAPSMIMISLLGMNPATAFPWVASRPSSSQHSS